MIAMLPAKARREESYDLPLTPMIDCVFLLIIFFTSIQFRRAAGELQLILPTQPGVIQQLPPSEVLVSNRVDVSVRVPPSWKARTAVNPKTGAQEYASTPQPVEISVDGEAIADFLALQAALESRRHEILRLGLTPMVKLELDPRLRYRYVVATVNSAKGAGFENISFTPPAGIGASSGRPAEEGGGGP